MGRRSRLAILAAFALCAALSAPPASADSDVHVFAGQKETGDSLLEDLGIGELTEYAIGVNLDFEWPVKLTIDQFRGDDDHTYTYRYEGSGGFGYDYTVEYEIETTELHVGARYEFRKDGRIRPYIGGGLAYVKSEGKIRMTFLSSGSRGTDEPFTLLDDDDTDVGLFANGGVAFLLNRRLSVGLDVRYSDAQAEFAFVGGFFGSFEVDVGGLHYGATLGYHW